MGPIFDTDSGGYTLRKVLRTKVARRILGTILLCAVLPLASFAVLAWLEIGKTMDIQAEQNTVGQSRSIGMTLYERLLFLDAELAMLAPEVGHGLAPDEARFKGFWTGGPDAGDRPFMLRDDQADSLAEGEPVLVVEEQEAGFPQLWLVRRAQPEAEAIVAGRISPQYLWNTENHLDPGSELHVARVGGTGLFTTMPGSRPPAESLTREIDADADRAMIWQAGGDSYLGASWDLFLARFHETPWRILVSITTEQAFATVRSFRGSFLLVGVLTLLLVLAASLEQVRKILGPVRRLHEATRTGPERLQEAKVEIRSGDEFEDLAESYNSLLDRVTGFIDEIQEVMRELEQARDVAIEAARTEAVFVENVSHEFRTPLTSIRSYAEILRNYPDEDIETRQEFMDILLSEAERMSRLVDDVLDLAKMQSGTMPLSHERLDPGSGLRAACRAMESLAESRSIDIQLIVKGDLPVIVGDEDRLNQVWLNLLSNAIKFSERGKRVEVRAHEGIDSVVVEVQDQGKGIPTEHLGRIFERFSQVTSDTLTDKPVGTGLGLSIVREIVHAHEGTVEVESRVGMGSLFRVSLPLRQRPDPDPGSEVLPGAESEPAAVPSRASRKLEIGAR